MNLKLLSPLLFVSVLIGFGCKSQQNNFEDVTLKFFDFVKKGNYAAAKTLCVQHFWEIDTLGVNWNLKQIHDALVTHTIPAKSKWTIKHDTAGIFKTTTYSLEIYRDDPNLRPKQGLVVDVSFDYTRQYAGDSIVFFNPHALWKKE